MSNPDSSNLSPLDGIEDITIDMSRLRMSDRINGNPDRNIGNIPNHPQLIGLEEFHGALDHLLDDDITDEAVPSGTVHSEGNNKA